MEKRIDGQQRVDGGRAWTITVVPTVTAGAYTADDLLGGEQTLTDAARWIGGTGILTGVSMSAEDDAANAFGVNDVEVIIFRSNPAGTYADNAALSGTNFTDDDAALILGSVLLDSISLLGNVSFSYARNCNIPYKTTVTANLWAVAINRGAVTPEATDSLSFTYHFIRD